MSERGRYDKLVVSCWKLMQATVAVKDGGRFRYRVYYSMNVLNRSDRSRNNTAIL